MSGKPKKKKAAAAEDPIGLFDIGYQEHVVEVIREWAARAAADYKEHEAETIERLLVRPLWRWIDQQGAGAERRADVRAALSLAEYATNDIAYSLRYRQQIYPEHVARLDDLWKGFQRVVGAGSVMQVSARHRKAASGPRVKVTKKQLEKFKESFADEQAKEGAKNPERGWKKAACIQFNITNKTLNDRLL